MRKYLRFVSQSVLGMLGLSVYILADTFFIANYINGVSPQECMRIAAMASTVQISRDGAAIAIPTKQEVLNALKNHCR